eukprot:2184524-Karenia_brevis.AAC.1
MSSIAQLLKHLDGVNAFFESQAVIGLSEDIQKQSMDGMTKSFIQQVAKLENMDVVDAAKLNCALG